MQRTFTFDTVQDSSPEMLEISAAGYEAFSADRNYISSALRTSFHESADKEAYRAAAENVFDEKAQEWRRVNGYED